MAGQTRSDYQLTTMFNEPALWEVRGEPQSIVCLKETLQQALLVAFQAGASNQIVRAIVKMPGEEIIILPDQIHRLSKHFRFDYSGGR